MAIRKELHDANLSHIFCEACGNSLSIRRVNRWQFEIEFEHYNGISNTYYYGADKTNQLIDDVERTDPEGFVYKAYYTTPVNQGMSNEEINKFINTLMPRMCSPFFKGFTLRDGTEQFVVEKIPGTANFIMDGKPTTFIGAIDETRRKLSQKHWEYVS